MSTAATTLDLEDFILEIGRRPVAELTQERLMDLTRRLAISSELIESRTCFAPNTYTRNLVCRSAALELLVLCWKPGHESTIHDHAGSLNAIRVHRGELTSRLFVPAAGSPVGTGPVELVAEERVQADGWTGVDRSGIHQLANTSGGDLVTVHVYAPPLLELTVYSTDSANVERRPLRHRLADDWPDPYRRHAADRLRWRHTMSLPTRTLGTSGLEITTVGFGSWATGGGGWAFGWGPQDDDLSIAAIHHALDLGVNWIDTAAIYGLGHSEEVVGRAVRALPADARPLVFTKCGLEWDAADPMRAAERVFTPHTVRHGIEGSLRRLGLESVDLFQIHWPDDQGNPVEEAWAEMVKLRDEGKARAIGVSNFDPDLLARCEADRPRRLAAAALLAHPARDRRGAAPLGARARHGGALLQPHGLGHPHRHVQQPPAWPPSPRTTGAGDRRVQRAGAEPQPVAARLPCGPSPRGTTRRSPPSPSPGSRAGRA